MRVLHFAKRSVVVGLLTLAAGCGSDSTAPDAPFNASGTSADVAAIGESFDSPALAAYTAAATSISAVVGGQAAAAVLSAPTAALLSGGKASALGYARSLSQNYMRRGPWSSSQAAEAMEIPAQYLGVTFVWDVESDQYIPSDLTGAPSAGVRFILYAVNPVTHQPVEPLVPIDGYADITVTETSTSSTVRIVVVSSDVTYLDYTVAASGVGTSGVVGISGFASNGNDRVDFDLDTRITSSEAGIELALDYEMVVPTRGGFLLDLEATITGFESQSPIVTLDLLARGDNGTVRIQGTATDAIGSFEVRVNGDLFATITADGDGVATVTGADGNALSEEEQQALRAVFDMFANGFAFFYDLTAPIG